MTKLREMTTRNIMIMLVVVLTILPLGLIVYTTVLHYQKSVENARLVANRVAITVANDQNSLLKGTEQLLSTLAYVPAIQKRDVQAANKLLAELIGKNPLITNLYIVDPGGDIWASAIPAKKVVNISDRRSFREARSTGNFSSGEYAIGKILQLPVINFTYPLRDASGRITNFAGVAFNLTKYSEMLRLKAIPVNTSLLIADHRGKILLSHPATTIVGKMDRPDLFAKMRQGPDDGSFEAVGNTGVRRIFAYRQLRLDTETTPYMYIRVGIATESFLSLTRSTLLLNVGAMLGALFLALLFVSYVIKHGIFDKVNALREATEKVARGHLDVRVSEHVHGGELGALGLSFDEMAWKLADDAAKREHAEMALKESEKKFRSLFNSIQDAIFLTSAEDGCIVECNQKLLGYSKEELIGKSALELGFWADPAERQKLLELNAAEGFVSDFETSLRRKDGSLFQASISVNSINLGDKVFLLSVMRDISERKKADEENLRLEQQLLHAQKLESLGVLAGGIAHDFNNILTSILGNTELALMRINPESPVIDNLKRIEQSSFRATEMAKQMLAYSGKGRFVVEPIDMNLLVQEMGHMLEVSISKKAILRYNLTRPLPSVEADATQIRQIVMNLVINASEAIGDKSGVIAISTGCIDCDRAYLKNVWLNQELAEGLYVSLEVADTGCGMDQDTKAKIFDPFFTTKFTGRGLGMAAVQGIIRGHKGAIHIQSEPGKGSSFKILLPASAMPAELFDAEPNDTSFRGEGTVLLVDDEETVRAIGSEMLRDMGFTVITAENGRDAVEKYKKHPGLFCVIMDLTMPHMDGEQALQELRAFDPAVKAIMSSGYSEFEVAQKLAGKGMFGFIQKPYRMSQLREAVAKVSAAFPS